ALLASSELWLLRNVLATEFRVRASNTLLVALLASSELWFLRNVLATEFRVSASSALLVTVPANNESWHLISSITEGGGVMWNSFSLLLRDVFFSFIISHPKLTIPVDKIRVFKIIVQYMNLSGQ
ncbi:hypothetical protein QMU90_003474, partial [Edwardsiella ictaluri]|nr:hypothetical protein [Edwardsiella ictaluri]